MPEYNDGSVPYGVPGTVGVLASVGGALIAIYILESLTVDMGGFQIERRNGSNVMSGRVAGDDSASSGVLPLNLTGTIRLQRATSSTPSPKVGNVFALSEEIAFTLASELLIGRYMVITGVTHNYSQTEAHIFDCNWACTGTEF